MVLSDLTMQKEFLAPDVPAAETNDGKDETNDDFSSPAINRHKAGRDHWEQEKEKLTLALVERILRGRASVAFSELKKAPIFIDKKLMKVGEIVLALLRNQARQIIRQEKPLVLQSKRRFELDDNDIRAQLRRLRDLLAERLVFDKNELQTAVAFAVRLQFDLLTKPRVALEQLIYSHSPLRRKTDVVVILEGWDDNHPLVVPVKNLLAEFPGELITKEDFAALCHRAEREVYGEHPVPALIADLQAYQQFCASLGPSSSARVRQQTVLRMLHERGLHELAENALPEQQWWAVADIAPALERALTQPSLPAFTVPPISPNGKDAGDAATASVETQIEAATTPESIGPRKIPPPAEIEFQEVDLQAILQVEEATIPPEPKIVYNDTDAAEQLIITRASLEAQPPGPYPSMTRLIDEKSRHAFIKKVFHQDLDAYLGFIEALEATQTWKEAKALLDGTFKQRKVNPYSKEAVQMSDLVFSRYFTRGAK